MHVAFCAQMLFLILSCLSVPCAQHLDAMLRVRTAFAALSSVCLCAAIPVLDLPRAATMDVNKPPFPTVNVIADQPITESAQVDKLRGARSAQQSLLERVDTAQKKFEAAAGVELDVQHQQLDKLRQMTARISGLA
jgi:hypothetical protein